MTPNAGLGTSFQYQPPRRPPGTLDIRIPARDLEPQEVNLVHRRVSTCLQLMVTLPSIPGRGSSLWLGLGSRGWAK